MKNKLFDIYWNTIAKWLIRRPYINRIRSQYKMDSPPTIIASNCIAGEIYNDLGLRFMSPTINLFFREKDFLKFVLNLQEYISCDLVFVNNHGGYPLAQLDDIQVHFLHYLSEDEAAGKWNARCKRIDYDNVYVIMSDLDLTDEEFALFQDISIAKRKILFTTNPQRANVKDVFLIREYEPYSYVSQYAVNRLNGFRDCERFWDFVSWLNGDDSNS